MVRIILTTEGTEGLHKESQSLFDFLAFFVPLWLILLKMNGQSRFGAGSPAFCPSFASGTHRPAQAKAFPPIGFKMYGLNHDSQD